MRLRPALPEEARLLSRLALRSKAYWGYNDSFMAACTHELAIRPEDVASRHVTVAVVDGAVAGHYTIDGADLGQLFVDPVHIGRGVGRALWTHAVGVARELGIDTLHVDSDPFAEGFYLAMGATRVGSVPSGSIPGRELPRLAFPTSRGRPRRQVACTS
jgi:GNAT superfamily N-acetyltransferase